MVATKEGAKKAAKTNIERYGEDFYRNLGRKGGKNNKHPRYFELHPEVAQEAGRRGGKASKRGKKTV